MIVSKSTQINLGRIALPLLLSSPLFVWAQITQHPFQKIGTYKDCGGSIPLYDSYRRNGNGLNPAGIIQDCDAYDYSRYTENQRRANDVAHRSLEELELVQRDLDRQNGRIRSHRFIERFERNYDGNFYALESRVKQTEENVRLQLRNLENNVRKAENIYLTEVQSRLIELQDRQMPEEQRRVDVKTNELRQSEAEIASLNKEIEQSQIQLNDLNKKVADLNLAKSQAFDKQKNLDQLRLQNSGRIGDLEIQIRDLDEKISRATLEQKPLLEELKGIKLNELESLKAPIANAEKDVQEAKRKVDQMQGQIGTDQQIADQIKKIQSKIEISRTTLGTLNKTTEDRRNELAQVQNQLNRTKERVTFLRTVQQRQIDALEVLRDINDLRPLLLVAFEIDRVRSDRQKAYDQKRYEADLASAVLQWVNVNLQNADKTLLSRVGAAGVAVQDAQSTATPRATDEGRRDGAYEGTEVARGKISGVAERGLQHAAYDGKQDGGAAGLEMKHPAGKAEGEELGKKDGLSRSVETARPEYISGFNQKENQLRTQALREVILGEDFNGLQKESSGQVTQEGEVFARKRLVSESLPAEILNDIFIYHFVNAYVPAYDMAYDSVYSEVEQSTSLQTEKSEKQRLVNELSKKVIDNISELIDSGGSDLFKSNRSRKITSNEIEDSLEQTVYFQHRDRNGRGKVRYTGAFDAENYRLSKETAYRLTEESTFQSNIDNQKRLFTQQGIDKATELYTNNAITEIIGAQLIEGEDDGVHRPGEKVSFRVKLKNFGKKALSGFKAILKVNGALVALTSQNDISIAGESETEVRGLLQSQIEPSAHDGNSFKANIELPNSLEINFGRLVGEIPTVKFVSRNLIINGQALYPIQVTAKDFDGLVIPGEIRSLELQLKNRSRKPVTSSIVLNGDSTKVNFLDQVLNKTVAAGDTETIQFNLTGREEARFEETGILAFVKQGALQFSDSLNLEAVVINRHKANKESQGLILSSNLAKGGGKFIYKAGQFDTWDLRQKVDGILANGQVLSKYTGKVVHLLNDQGVPLDGVTLSSLNSHIQNGGTLIVWGANNASLEISKALNLNIESGQEITINQGLVGTQSFRTLRSNRVYGGGLALRIDQTRNGDRKRVFPAFKLEDGTLIGTLSFRDSRRAESDKPGRVLTLGLNAEDLSHTDGLIAQIQEATRLAGLGFQEKMKLAKTRTDLQFLVLEDIKQEMRSMDVERDDGVYKNGSDNDDRSKMSQALNLLKYVSKNGNNKSEDKVRIAFAKLYPEAQGAAEDMYQTPFKYAGRLNAGKMVDEKQVRVRDGGFFSKRNESWKQAWESVGNL